MLFMYNLSEVIGCILYFVFSILVLEALFDHSAHWNIRYLLLAMILYFPLTYPPLTRIPNIAGSLISMGIIYGLSIICYTGTSKTKFLVIILYNICDILVGNLVFFLSSTIFNKSFDELSISGSFARIYLLIMIYLIEYLCITRLKKHTPVSVYISAEGNMISFLFFLCSFGIVFINYSILFYLSEENTMLELLCLILTCLMLLMIFMTMFLLNRLWQKNQRLYEYNLTKIQVKQQQKQLLSLKENEEQIKEIRHDTKNYLISYRALLIEGRIQEVIDELDKMIDTKLAPKPTEFCSNQLVNTLLMQKYMECQEKNIPISVHTIISDSYEDIETLVAISNLIDNAIEASEKLPPEKASVSIEIVPRPNGISILIANHIDRSVLLANPDLTTTKPDKKQHGIGIQSAKRIIEQKNGILEIYEENNKFCVQIYIPCFGV